MSIPELISGISLGSAYVRPGTEGAITSVSFIAGGWITVDSFGDLTTIDHSRTSTGQIAFVSQSQQFYIAKKIPADFETTFDDSVGWTKLTFSGSFSGSFFGDGSGLTGIASSLFLSGSTGNDVLNLKTDALTLTGSAQGIVVVISDNKATFTISNTAVITGSFSGNGAGLTGVAAAPAGNDKTVQFRSGSLTGGAVDFVYDHATGRVGIGTVSPSAKLTVDGDVVVTGKITAEEFHTEFVSASIIFQSGSTKFGNSADDNHTFTGTVNITGSVIAPRFSGSFSGSFEGDGSNLTGIASSLTISGSTGTDVINLKTESLTITGSARNISVAVTNNTATISVASDLTLTNVNLTGSFSGPLAGNATTATSATSASHAVSALSASYVIGYVKDGGGLANEVMVWKDGETASGSQALRFNTGGATLNVTGNVIATSFTGSFSGSFVGAVTNAVTASFALNALSASYAATASSADAFIVRNTLIASGLTYPIADGLENQYIQTNGAGTLSFNDVHTLLEDVRSGEALTKGDPLYISGSLGAKPIVYKADAGVPAKMPVIYIALETVNSGSDTRGIVLGLIEGVNTTGYPTGTEIYVAVGGGWTSTRPTGSATVQSLGYITKEGPGGKGIILNPGPFNLPNLQKDYVWKGNASGVPVAVASSSLIVTQALNATSASFATFASTAGTATSASFATFASTAGTATSASFATFANTAGTATSASFATSANTATSASHAIFANTAGTATSASHAIFANTAGTATTATSASFATFANTAGTATSAATASFVAGYAKGTGVANEVTIWKDSSTVSGSNWLRVTSSIDGFGTPGLQLDGNYYSYAVSSTGGNGFVAFSGSVATTASIIGINASISEGQLYSSNAAEVRSAIRLSSLYTDAYTIGRFLTPGANNLLRIAPDVLILGSTTINGDLTVGGKVTAEEFHTEFISASIIFKSGSTIFGNSSDDVHQFTGSVNISHQLYAGLDNEIRPQVVGYNTATGELTYFNSSSILATAIPGGTNQQVQYNNNGVTAGASGFVWDGTNVGIGTTSPNSQLDVYTSQGGSKISILHGTGGTYPKASGISFGATTTSLTVSNNGGTTTFTGGAGIYANNSVASNNPTDLIFWTTAGGSPTERVRITTDGNVGIGTSNPLSKLQVNKSSQAYTSPTASGALVLSDTAGTGAALDMGVSTTYLSYIQSRYLDSSAVYQLLLNPGGGSVGIGTTSPGDTLHVVGNAIVGNSGNISPDSNGNGQLEILGSGYQGYVAIDGTGMHIGHNSAVRTLVLQTNETSRLTIDGNTGAIRLNNYGGGSITGTATKTLGIDSSGNVIELDVSSNGTGAANQVAFWKDTDTVSGSASLTWNGTTFYINGTLEATEKSFVIDHPILPGKKLVYGVLEGPEHAVYCRGKISGEVIQLPEEWTGLVDQESITVQLTPIGRHQNLYVVDIKNNQVLIKNGDLLSSRISAHYFIQATRKDVKPLATVREA